jgi:hypothetical protein
MSRVKTYRWKTCPCTLVEVGDGCILPVNTWYTFTVVLASYIFPGVVEQLILFHKINVQLFISFILEEVLRFSSFF